MIADIEKAEKELDFANRKIKQLEDVNRKLKVDNDQLKIAKRGIADDLSKLMAKRQDIENLQKTLMGIIQHSNSKKIDVDDLKGRLADSVRRDKYSHPFSSDGGMNADITLKYVEGKKRSGLGGRSKSPLGHSTLGNNSSNPMLDNASS